MLWYAALGAVFNEYDNYFDCVANIDAPVGSDQYTNEVNECAADY